MIRLLRKKNRFSFYPADLKETKDVLINPLRGWYKIFYFNINEKPDFHEIECNLDDEHMLVMAFADISSLPDCDCDLAKNNLIDILKYFESKEKDVILRFAYDTKGKALEEEPFSFKTVLEHAKWIVESLQNNSRNVFIVQGLILGNWGEMHTSKHISDENFRRIYAFFDDLDKDIYLAVRKPVQWRLLNLNFSKTNDMTGIRMGIFNDGMFGSISDLGTYGSDSKEDVGYRSEWNVNDEVDFINMISEKCPVGGECVFDSSKEFDSKSVAERLRKTGVTYLNIEHDKRFIETLKNRVYSGADIFNGDSLFEYVTAHLGYRFIAKKATVKKDREGLLCISAEIENRGFAPIYQNADIYIEIVNKEISETHKITNGLNGILPGKTTIISASFKQKNGIVFLYAKRQSDGRMVFFANERDNGKTILGKLENRNE